MKDKEKTDLTIIANLSNDQIHRIMEVVHEQPEEPPRPSCSGAGTGGGEMPFIELTRFPKGRLLINPSNISSIYLGRKRDGQSANYLDVTVIQETTSADNYWEVTETIDEIISLLKAQEEEK